MNYSIHSAVGAGAIYFAGLFDGLHVSSEMYAWAGCKVLHVAWWLDSEMKGRSDMRKTEMTCWMILMV